MTDKVLDHDATTRLVTDLHFIGAGPQAISELQSRLDKLTANDSRVIVGEIMTSESGAPICGISFNCDSYDPPVDGVPDPRALADLRNMLNEYINFDGCASWGTIETLTADRV